MPALDDHESQCKSFDQDGFLVMRDLLPSDILSEWKEFVGQQDLVHWLFRELHSRGHTAFAEESRIISSNDGNDGSGGGGGSREYSLGHGVKNGFCEIVMRSPGRYEISLLNLEKYAQLSMPSLPNLYQALEKAGISRFLSQDSWNNVSISNVSLVVSTPGSATQGWHADGGHVDLQKHLPCHCLNVFCALEDVTRQLGPTELRPGTQVHTRNLGPMMLAAHCQKTLRKPMTPILSAGDALCFDYRILHRGLPNTTADQNRCMLVITVAQSWFKDLLNFPKNSFFSKPDEDETEATSEVNEEKVSLTQN
mmetsp:Transcript_19697/g.25371  ORF Transcript_19697/g.25371 Transcript_19697/m.25371 type:complete len:309 (-) Transcript_19697:146-1072(-)